MQIACSEVVLVYSMLSIYCLEFKAVKRLNMFMGPLVEVTW